MTDPLKNIDDDSYYSIKDLIYILDEVELKVRTIQYWIRINKLPAIKPGLRWLVNGSDFKSFFFNTKKRDLLQVLPAITKHQKNKKDINE